MTVRSHVDPWKTATEDETDDGLAVRVARFRGLVYGIALAVLRDPAEAEEVAQDVFLRAGARRRQLRAEERFRAWVARIAHRLALNRRRELRRRRAREREWHRQRPATVHGEAEGRLLAADVRRAVEALPEKLRDVLLLSAVEGLDSREIGELLALPPGTVRSRLHAARRRLLEVME